MSNSYEYSFFRDSWQTYRPILPIRIINPSNSSEISVRALLDTGADDCVFPKFIAETLHYNLKGSSATFITNQGIGESKVNLWKHKFKIYLLSPNNLSVIWQGKICSIGCTDHNLIPPLLGWSNFLCNFTITFNYSKKKIIVELP